MSHLIEMNDIHKSFYDNVVLSGVSFAVKPGCFSTLIGENGSGKSTILRILMGHEKFEKGDGQLLGYPFIGNHQAHKVDVGYVTESIEYNVPMSMIQFSEYYRTFYPRWDHDLFLRLVKDRQLDLSKKFNAFSRGQRMQVALIMALAARPKILLIDEITSVLDIYARKYFLSELSNFVKAGGSVLLTTNILTEVQQVTTHLILLNQGRIQLNSSMDEIPMRFRKLRRPDGATHPIFDDPHCVWAGTGTDQSTMYLIPSEHLEKYNLPEMFQDRRRVQLEDVFVFYFNFHRGDRHE